MLLKIQKSSILKKWKSKHWSFLCSLPHLFILLLQTHVFSSPRSWYIGFFLFLGTPSLPGPFFLCLFQLLCGSSEESKDLACITFPGPIICSVAAQTYPSLHQHLLWDMSAYSPPQTPARLWAPWIEIQHQFLNSFSHPLGTDWMAAWVDAL